MVPSIFLGEVLLTVAYVINRIPNAHDFMMCPYEKLYGKLLDYSLFQVFLGVPTLFYDFTYSGTIYLQNQLYVYSWGMILVKNDINVTCSTCFQVEGRRNPPCFLCAWFHLRSNIFITCPTFWRYIVFILFITSLNLVLYHFMSFLVRKLFYLEFE